MDKLILGFKQTKLKEYPFDKDTITIGRKPDNDIHIDNPVVSSHHAHVIRRDGKVFLEDLNSTNGTYVNQKKVAKLPLKHKDKIVIGKHVILFLSDDPVAQLMAEESKEDDLDATMVLAPKAAQAGPGGGPAPGVGGVTIMEGTTEKKEYQLSARLSTIGKAETSTIKLKGLLAPKTAALINRTDKGYLISPPGSGAKIKINGQALTGRAPLKDGDIIECYGLKMQFFVSS
jgi:pSer/pThr/pTyr-binding forkhead associated (FHA) protein